MPRQKLRTGALRNELLGQAISALEDDGPTAVKARHVASAAGTSVAALYELFGDKTGLVRAIFYEGFRSLLERLDNVPTTTDSRADVTKLLAASRTFAVRRPMLFELMYGRPFSEFHPEPEDLRVAARIYDLVVDRVRRWLDDVACPTDPVDAAHALVALNRGLVAAELSGVLGRSAGSRDRRWHVAVDALLDGLVVRANAVARPG